MPKKKTIIILLFLTAAPLLAFWQVIRCDFINFDDDVYVTTNSIVQEGLTLKGIRWAFTTGQAANWHPVTWISHMLDVQLFGLRPEWHHLTNLGIHIANTLLLFLIFSRMTKAPWQSALVAALFALHPLHVESVAWVAERKDVLSALFWMLTIGAYILYVEYSGVKRYLAILFLFSLGLMAKPMLVTLPFVLLLLDYWPLKRIELTRLPLGIGTQIPNHAYRSEKIKKQRKRYVTHEVAKQQSPLHREYRRASIRTLLWEKTPFFALVAISSVVTYVVQQKNGAVQSIDICPLSARISNAIISYVAYIEKTIWPDNLSIFYPHPIQWPLWQIFGATMVLIAVTIAVMWKAKSASYLLVGWLWYLGTLVPVIGIVQVGAQAMADRYTYIPSIGLFMMAAWGVPEILKPWRYRKEALAGLSLFVLTCLSIVTFTQVKLWENNITLYDHALNVTKQNRIILNSRGVAYNSLGKYRQAIENLDKAIAINPTYADAYNNKSYAHIKLGNFTQAIRDADNAIANRQKFADAYNNRGVALSHLGEFSQAIKSFDTAIEINPQNDSAFCNRGVAYGMLNNYRQAIEDFDHAVELNPKFAEAYYYRSIAYDKLGNQRQALDDLKAAARLGSKTAEDFLRSYKIEWQ
jgi:lipoprotein NlpI